MGKYTYFICINLSYALSIMCLPVSLQGKWCNQTTSICSNLNNLLPPTQIHLFTNKTNHARKIIINNIQSAIRIIYFYFITSFFNLKISMLFSITKILAVLATQFSFREYHSLILNDSTTLIR